jgi:hypothetical protein
MMAEPFGMVIGDHTDVMYDKWIPCCEGKGSSPTENEHSKVRPMKTHDTMGMGMV